MTEGSHHLFVFTLPNEELTGTGLVDCPGGHLEFHDFIHASQTPKMLIPYGPGIGRFVAAGTGFRIMLHIINATDTPKDAFVKLRTTYVDPDAVTYRAASMFLNYIGLSVPPGKSTVKASYEIPYDIYMIGALSHMHSRGVHFLAQTDDGRKLFETDTWEEPTPVAFDPPVKIDKGTKIEWSCDYQNDTGLTMTFGESAAKNEMCIFPGKFYGGDGSGIVPLVP